mmetsp:Transcript_31203/g.80916  ORF Transcript_31203/g.80916 Transcript_31203/m.80916 type:complete len:95 (-) Transcript_31203:786-1070(-)
MGFCKDEDGGGLEYWNVLQAPRSFFFKGVQFTAESGVRVHWVGNASREDVMQMSLPSELWSFRQTTFAQLVAITASITTTTKRSGSWTRTLMLW